MNTKTIMICSLGLALALSSCATKHAQPNSAAAQGNAPAVRTCPAPLSVAASPESVSGRTVILIRTAEETCYEGSNVWKPSENKSPRVFRFKHGNSYKPLTGSEDPGPGYLNRVTYTKTGPDTAIIKDAEWEGCSDYTLKFTSPTSGNVSESGGAEGMEWKARGATFIIR